MWPPQWLNYFLADSCLCCHLNTVHWKSSIQHRQFGGWHTQTPTNPCPFPIDDTSPYWGMFCGSRLKATPNMSAPACGQHTVPHTVPVPCASGDSSHSCSGWLFYLSLILVAIPGLCSSPAVLCITLVVPMAPQKFIPSLLFLQLSNKDMG